MNCYRPIILVVLIAWAVPASALQPPQRRGSERSVRISSIERWVQQLENEIDHLQEDIFYERGRYPAGLQDQARQASGAVTHFRHILRRPRDRQHLLRDFEEMDQQVHQLVRQLESGDSWLRRQASRISYADEQLHYVLQTRSRDGREGDAARELLARHAHVLESEAKNLQRLVERLGRRSDGLKKAVAEFAEEAEHFHKVVERGGDVEHMEDDFKAVDAAWRRAVEHINRMPSQIFLMRRAQDVNRVHNQIRDVVTDGDGDQHDSPAEVPQRSRRIERARDRPSIQFEIPGVGRFEFPR